jgi:hypothetical protein
MPKLLTYYLYYLCEILSWVTTVIALFAVIISDAALLTHAVISSLLCSALAHKYDWKAHHHE